MLQEQRKKERLEAQRKMWDQSKKMREDLERRRRERVIPPHRRFEEVYNGSTWDRMRRATNYASMSTLDMSMGPTFSPLEQELLASHDPEMVEIARDLIRERYKQATGRAVTF